MPIKKCTTNGGSPGLKWGNRGHCYSYTPNNKASRLAAKKKVLKQALKIGYETGKIDEIKKELSSSSEVKDIIKEIVNDSESSVEELQAVAAILDDPVQRLFLSDRIVLKKVDHLTM